MNERFYRYSKSPRCMSDMIRMGGPHVFLPHLGLAGRRVTSGGHTIGSFWRPDDAQFFYETMPERFRVIFPVHWENLIKKIHRIGDLAAGGDASRVLIGQFVLAYSAITGMSIDDSCQFFLDIGLQLTLGFPPKDPTTPDYKSGLGFAHLLALAGYEARETARNRPINDAELYEWIRRGDPQFTDAAFVPSIVFHELGAHGITRNEQLTVGALRHWVYEARGVPDVYVFLWRSPRTDLDFIALARAGMIDMPTDRHAFRQYVRSRKLRLADLNMSHVRDEISSQVSNICNLYGYCEQEFCDAIRLWERLADTPRPTEYRWLRPAPCVQSLTVEKNWFLR